MRCMEVCYMYGVREREGGRERERGGEREREKERKREVKYSISLHRMISSILQASSQSHFQFHVQKKNSIEKNRSGLGMMLLDCIFPAVLS